MRAYSRGACVTDVDSIREEIKKERVSFCGTVRTGTITYRQHRTPSVRGVRVSPVVEFSVGKQVHRCRNCGLVGHNSSTCPNN